MKKDDKASISLIKILAICLIVITLTSVSVMATSSQISNVKIILSNDYEMTVVTANKTVADILAENNIKLAEDEVVTPSLEEELSDNKTIHISKADEQENIVAEKEEVISQEEILQGYNTITEKIIVEQIVIPFETITKEASGSASSGTKQNKVIQNGENGLKEVTYKVKYQNNEEIERNQISEVIVKEPVDKIVEVKTIQLTSRSSGSRVTSYGNGSWSYSASDLDLICAITAQEASSSYEAALAVITCACNRAASSRWRKYGSYPLSQYKAPNQFCYTIDSHWKKRLNGNYPSHVKQAVLDALNGKRNHRYLSFRSASTGISGVNIGGNVYFNPM